MTVDGVWDNCAE